MVNSTLKFIMEKRLNNKLEQYIKAFKDNIRDKVISLGLENESQMGEFMEYVYDYDRLVVDKNDFVKDGAPFSVFGYWILSASKALANDWAAHISTS